jgi:hypothetical protein
MDRVMILQCLADLVLLLHVLFVVFVVGGLFLILFGGVRKWRWVRNPGFRLAHTLSIGVVVVQSWFAVICPLTMLENALRAKAGDTAYEGSFIAHWLQAILYYNAPAWAFAVCYTVFGALVFASWVIVRPMPFSQRNQLT